MIVMQPDDNGRQHEYTSAPSHSSQPQSSSDTSAPGGSGLPSMSLEQMRVLQQQLLQQLELLSRSQTMIGQQQQPSQQIQMNQSQWGAAAVTHQDTMIQHSASSQQQNLTGPLQQHLQNSQPSSGLPDDWHHLLQPTPLSPDCQQRSPAGHGSGSQPNFQQSLQSSTQQTDVHQTLVQQTNNNTAQWFQELWRSAQQAQQQAAEKDAAPNAPLYSLGSQVAPVYRSDGTLQLGLNHSLGKSPGIEDPSEPQKLNLKRKVDENHHEHAYKKQAIQGMENTFHVPEKTASQSSGSLLSSDEEENDDFAPTPWSVIQAKEQMYSSPRQVTSTSTRYVPPAPLASQHSKVQDATTVTHTSYQQQQQQVNKDHVSTKLATAPPQVHSFQQITVPSQHLPTQPLMVPYTVESQGAAPKQQYPFILPSTMVPPSVLASVLPAENPRPPATKKVQPKKPSTGSPSRKQETPQQVLEGILLSRNYGTFARFKADQANYGAAPSALQLASFGTEVVKAFHTSNVEHLSKLLSCGLSPNPCNQFRDSIIDLVCKRANFPVFQCLIDHGCDLRVCDGFGRTPLHHCCWASTFSEEVADGILRRDWQQLFMEDKRGQTPLEYVRPDQYEEWISFLRRHQDRYFPLGGRLPAFKSLKRTRSEGYMPDPPNALPVRLAAALSAGEVNPEEVMTMTREQKERYPEIVG